MIAALLVVLGAAAAAHAGPPGTWTRLSEGNGSNIDQVALARGLDNVLNAVWPAKTGNTKGYRHARVAPNGSLVAGPVAVLDGWSKLNNPALVVGPDGSLRLLFAGITAGPFLGRATSATAPPGGSSWTFTRALHTDNVGVNESADSFGAAAKLDGTPVFSWGANVKVGLDPTPELDLMEGCCAYDSDVAVDAVSGEVVVGWYSNVAGQYGYLTRTVDPALGETRYAPNSAREDRKAGLAPGQRTALTARRGAPGVYIAYRTGYPSSQTVSVWRHGGGSPLVVARAKSRTSSVGDHVAIVPGPDGRLWVMWEKRSQRVYATRSNRAATTFGAVVEVKPPADTRFLWKVAGDGALGPLDLVASASTPGSLAFWHTQVLPGLSLACRGGSVVSCRVSDAGDPVRGAKVKIGGRTLTTNARGKASADLPAGSYRVTVWKAGYEGGQSAIASLKAT